MLATFFNTVSCNAARKTLNTLPQIQQRSASLRPVNTCISKQF